MQLDQLQKIIEAALLVAARPMSVAQLETLFAEDNPAPSRDEIREALAALTELYEDRGIELTEVASGWRMQSRQEMSPWIANLFQEKAPRYSRALLETLVLVAYRQPITRGEIEDVRGVAVNSYIIKTLIERNWVKVVGHRDVPGRPELLATTREFLDYFNLKKIGDLPTLAEIKSLEEIAPDLAKEVDMLEAAEASEGDPEQSQQESESTDEEVAATESSMEPVLADSSDDEAVTDDEVSNVDDIVLLDEDDPIGADEGVLVAQEDTESENGQTRVATVDVELPPDEEQPHDELFADDSDESEQELNVNEATIDALSQVTRSESELLH